MRLMMTFSRSCFFVVCVVTTVIIYVILSTEFHSVPITVQRPEVKSPETKSPETKSPETKSPEVTETNEGSLQLRDVIHTVKTSKATQSRVEPILLTWFKQAAEQTYFITDEADLPLALRTNQHLVPSSCKGDHGPYGLSCKMNLEFDQFMKRVDGKWWCHWDDDNYVNLKLLIPLLDRYDWRQPWYLGRASVDHKWKFKYNGQGYAARFAHGGCGFCVSRALANMMVPYASDGKLLDFSHQTGFNDDCVVGGIVNGILEVDLTQVEELNSHYHWERLINLKNEELPRQISLSYNKEYCVNIRQPIKSFSREEDPSRFYSVHCMNYPELEYCKYLPDKDSN